MRTQNSPREKIQKKNLLNFLKEKEKEIKMRKHRDLLFEHIKGRLLNRLKEGIK